MKLAGIKTIRNAEFACVMVHDGKKTGYYRVTRGGAYLASNEKHLTIGLGDSREARWEVLWPSGQRQDCGIGRAGTRYRVVEGNPPVDVPPL